MPSRSLSVWNTNRAATLDQIEAAHRSVGGRGPGRRYATQQLNHAYAVLLAAQFQGFCRDLHSECIDFLVAPIALAELRSVVREEFFHNRRLQAGNATPANIAADFGRLGITDLWTRTDRDRSGNERRRQFLERLNAWRNAIAHQDFDPGRLVGAILRLDVVRRWRRACQRLAQSLDNVTGPHIGKLTGKAPW